MQILVLALGLLLASPGSAGARPAENQAGSGGDARRGITTQSGIVDGGATPAANAGESFVLMMIYYRDTGVPFGSVDYGLRAPQPFCLRQREIVQEKWKTEGATAFAADAFWLPDRGYAAKLFCIEQKKYDNPRYRSRLLRQHLSR